MNRSGIRITVTSRVVVPTAWLRKQPVPGWVGVFISFTTKMIQIRSPHCQSEFRAGAAGSAEFPRTAGRASCPVFLAGTTGQHVRLPQLPAGLVDACLAQTEPDFVEKITSLLTFPRAF